MVEFWSGWLNIFLVVNEMTGRSMTHWPILLLLLTINCISCVWYKAFTLMRMFENPSVFINSLKNQITGIGSFLLMLFIINAAFVNVLYILSRVDTNQLKVGEYEPAAIMTEHFKDNHFVNAVLHMYLLSNGEYDLDGFGARDDFFGDNQSTKVIQWLLFIAATFVLQIVFMNMLVALMGNI